MNACYNCGRLTTNAVRVNNRYYLCKTCNSKKLNRVANKPRKAKKYSNTYLKILSDVNYGKEDMP